MQRYSSGMDTNEMEQIDITKQIEKASQTQLAMMLAIDMLNYAANEIKKTNESGDASLHVGRVGNMIRSKSHDFKLLLEHINEMTEEKSRQMLIDFYLEYREYRLRSMKESDQADIYAADELKAIDDIRHQRVCENSIQIEETAWLSKKQSRN